MHRSWLRQAAIATLALWCALDCAWGARADPAELHDAAVQRASSGDLPGSVPLFKQAIAALEDPTLRSQVRYNLAYTLMQLGRGDDALRELRESVRENPGFSEAHVKAAYMLVQRGQLPEAVVHLQLALQLRPNDGMVAVHLADTLNNMKRWKEALEVYEQAAQQHPDAFDAHLGMASTLMNLQRPHEAAPAYQRAIAAAGDNRRKQGEALAGAVHAQLSSGGWRALDGMIAQLRRIVPALVQSGAPSPVSPHLSLLLPLPPPMRLSIATSWARMVARMLNDAAPRTERVAIQRQAERLQLALQHAATSGPAPRFTLGYISRRFEEYPGTQLMLRLFGAHNRSRVRVVSLAHGPDDGSTERRVVQRSSDAFHDVSLLPVAGVARKVADEGVHVLIDYDGAHDFNNLQVLALRPALAQATFLGFAGTTGASKAIDWLVTDPVLTPPEFAPRGFSERLLLLPHTYQPQDDEQPIDSALPLTRAAAGLPDAAAVFVCFNRIEKLLPDVFGTWMQVLARVPGSVLWLLSASEEVQARLRVEATARGVHPRRVVFAARLPKPAHLARHRLADVALDTGVYGSHTMCSDALWAGLPMLTVAGEQMPARVPTSILASARLRWLAVGESRELADVAAELGVRPRVITALKRRVAALSPSAAGSDGDRTSRTCPTPLFCPRTFAGTLERAGRAMLESKLSSVPRSHVVVVAEGYSSRAVSAV